MEVNHGMQEERYELKYLIPASLKQPIRDFISSYLELDAFAKISSDYAYTIHSVYLDSPSLRTHRATQSGDRNRFKLRIRYYDDKPESSVFLEVKRRNGEVIHKSRCMVARHALSSVLSGDTSSLRAKDIEVYTNFSHMMRQLQAAPRAYVAYKREAWVSPHDNSVRVTMDSDVMVEPKFDLTPQTATKNPVSPFGEQIVLELKYTARYPEWFRGLVHRFHLMQSGGPKYSAGVILYGEQQFMRHAGTSFEWTTETAIPKLS